MEFADTLVLTNARLLPHRELTRLRTFLETANPLARVMVLTGAGAGVEMPLEEITRQNRFDYSVIGPNPKTLVKP